MDVRETFRQGLGVVSRAQQARAARGIRDGSHDPDDHAARIAHTLAACCRCRQRKTRCDATLPKCITCERVGAVCEYWDPVKGKKVSRSYVVKLQDKVRALEAELDQYTEDDLEPLDTEAAIRPGGLVHLDDHDELPRFLGPSSGIAMARLVMEEAKRYTDSHSIRELVPEVATRRTPAGSPMTDGSSGIGSRAKLYPVSSSVAADKLPNRLVADRLIEDVFIAKAQYLFPTLHEPTFRIEVEEVYNGDGDHYKNFVLKMVLAISMAKLDMQYAGLADGYYLAAMAHYEAVIARRDIKTIQCLVLIMQYSLLTPTCTALYYVIGLAVRLCQQLGLTEEKTIVQGSTNPSGQYGPMELEMRRRMSWCVLNIEFGLSHGLGRPNNFAIREDHFDVKFFALVDDEYISEQGVAEGAPRSEKKAMCETFFHMRILQSEIRRLLYQTKRLEPQDDKHPWFAHMAAKLRRWLENSPESLPWSRAWFTGKYNAMVVFLYRPSPQIPVPSVAGAKACYDASAYNIIAAYQQIDSAGFDITWVFLQSAYMAVNVILWTTSYPELRALHPRDEVEELVRKTIVVIMKCKERWPGSESAAELYAKLSKACLRSYSVSDSSASPLDSGTSSTSAPLEASSPRSDLSAGLETLKTSKLTSRGSKDHYVHGGRLSAQSSTANQPSFGYVFNEAPDSSRAAEFHDACPSQPPAFRSGSIFADPISAFDRRISFSPPETSQVSTSWNAVPQILQQPHPVQLQRHFSDDQASMPMPQFVSPQQSPPLQEGLPQTDPLFFDFTGPVAMMQQYQMPAYNPLLHPIYQLPYDVNSAFDFPPQLFDANGNYNAPARHDLLSMQQQDELLSGLEDVITTYGVWGAPPETPATTYGPAG